AEQWSKLRPLLIEELEEYGPEFDQMFSPGSTFWFLQSHYVLTPVAGIPEKEMKQILSGEQWKQLTSAQQFSNAQNYWQNIASNHKRRVKAR
ncbi:MAG: hypothetical protein ABIO94_03490, partial [Opitutaceae bacterium]